MRATCRSGSARCVARSPGATISSRSRSAASSAGSGSSPAAGPPSWRRRSRIPPVDLGVDILDGLESLADKSLVRIEAAGADAAPPPSDEPRFDMHPLLREYALERLGASDERAGPGGAPRGGGRRARRGGRARRSSEPAVPPTIRRLDLEQHNVRAAIDWALADRRSRHRAPRRRRRSGAGSSSAGGCARPGRSWHRLRARPIEDPRLRDRRAGGRGRPRLLVGRLRRGACRVRGAPGPRRRRPATPAFAPTRTTTSASCSWSARTRTALRAHEQQALDLYTRDRQAGRASSGRDRPSRSALFLTGDFNRALEVEAKNLEAFRAAGSAYQVADSMTFHAGVYFKLGDPATSWRYVCDGLRWFAENDNAERHRPRPRHGRDRAAHLRRRGARGARPRAPPTSSSARRA